MRQKEERQKAKGAKERSAEVANGDQNKTKERTFKQREAIIRDVREQKGKRKSFGQSITDASFSNKKFKASPQDDSNSQALQGALSKIF